MGEDIAREVAKSALEIGAIKLRPEDPFTWASGYRMPIYNDNRMFLFHPGHRDIVFDGLTQILGYEHYGVLAGTSTAGIPWGAMLAMSMDSGDLGVPFVYIRDKPKDHGLKNQIEGLDAEKDFEGRTVIVIEDLISTGGSSAAAVQAVRNANGKCNKIVSIFNYGFNEAVDIFEGRRAYNKEGAKLSERCGVDSVLTYDTLLSVAKEVGYLTDEQIKLLQEWRVAPFEWGAKHGFPKVEKAK